jgi:hypothetical protein
MRREESNRVHDEALRERANAARLQKRQEQEEAERVRRAEKKQADRQWWQARRAARAEKRAALAAHSGPVVFWWWPAGLAPRCVLAVFLALAFVASTIIAGPVWGGVNAFLWYLIMAALRFFYAKVIRPRRGSAPLETWPARSGQEPPPIHVRVLVAAEPAAPRPAPRPTYAPDFEI